MSKTFWEICKESQIEIPEIQRDYAQGRIDDRVNSIRKGFVKSLLNATAERQNLNLDFIFGKSIDKKNQANFNENRHNLEQMLVVLKKYSDTAGVAFSSSISQKPLALSENKQLIPFDGQQRLTTLFLLHLYIGVNANKEIGILNNFLYKTRESTSEFLKSLLDNYSVLAKEDTDTKKMLSEYIMDQSWFFTSWKKDPTVSGMLVVLDEINKQATEIDVDFENAWLNITENNVINFDYFDIQEEGFDEDLYVKMNARGKGLTDFENFRAWLEKKHKATLPEYNWIYKIDKDWLDLFWKTRGVLKSKDKKSTVKNIDTNFLAFFKNTALLFHLSNSESKKKDSNFDKEKELTNLLSPNKFATTLQYEENGIFNTESLNFIFKTLDILANDKLKLIDKTVKEIWVSTFSIKENKSFSKLLLTEFDNLNLFHKVFFFSILKFLHLLGKSKTENYTEEDKRNFKNWIRVSRNLIYNTRIDDISAYVPAIVAIENLEPNYILNIAETLPEKITAETKRWIGFYTLDQQKEEIKKNNLIHRQDNGDKWSGLITRAENHFYFYGQIGFILHFSAKDITEVILNNGEVKDYEEHKNAPLYDVEKFKTYLIRLENLFSEQNINSPDYILQCLFFAFDDKEIWLNEKTVNRYSFYKSSYSNARDRDENWRIVFERPEKKAILKNFLNSNSCSKESVLEVINSKKQELNIDNWKYLILDKPQILRHCGKSYIAISDSYLDFKLLEKEQKYSKQRELRSFHYYNKISKPEFDKEFYAPFETLRYFTGERNNFNPCIIFENWEYKKVNYYIVCIFTKNNFEIKLGAWNNAEIDEELQRALFRDNTFENSLPEENVISVKNIKYSELHNNLEAIFITVKKQSVL